MRTVVASHGSDACTGKFMSGVSHLVLENVGIENQESFGQAVALEHLQTPERLSAWHTSSQPANVTVPYDVPDAALHYVQRQRIGSHRH